MEEKPIESSFFTRDALDIFVRFGVLLKVKKNGEDAWIENPSFRKKTLEGQEEVFKKINENH